jgi:hypothetical protein
VLPKIILKESTEEEIVFTTYPQMNPEEMTAFAPNLYVPTFNIFLK